MYLKIRVNNVPLELSFVKGIQDFIKEEETYKTNLKRIINNAFVILPIKFLLFKLSLISRASLFIFFKGSST